MLRIEQRIIFMIYNGLHGVTPPQYTSPPRDLQPRSSRTSKVHAVGDGNGRPLIMLFSEGPRSG